jgi:hypothetical protein
MKDEFATWRAGVDVLRHAVEADTALVQVRQRLDEVLEGPAETVQAPDNERVPLAQVVKRIDKAWSLRLGSGGNIAVEPRATRLVEGVFLQVERLLSSVSLKGWQRGPRALER